MTHLEGSGRKMVRSSRQPLSYMESVCLKGRKKRKGKKVHTIPVLRRQRQEDPEFKASFSCIGRPKLSLDRLKCKIKTGEMTPWVRMLVEDWDLSPSTHFRQLTTACKSSSRESDSLFWSLCVPAFTCTYTHTQIYMYT